MKKKEANLRIFIATRDLVRAGVYTQKIALRALDISYNTYKKWDRMYENVEFKDLA